MTQAAVSYQIKVLEERLGVPLFTRAGRGLVLTETGGRIAPEVTRAFELMDKAFGSVRDDAESVLTISAPINFSTNWLAGRLGSFQLTRPGLAVRLLADDALVDLAAGTADVAIRAGVPPWPGLAQHFLMRMAFAPFASPGLIAQHHPIANAHDLLAMPRLADEHWWPAWFHLAGVEVPMNEPKGGVRFDSQLLQGNAAINGHGVALLTPFFWTQQIASGQLVRLSPLAACWRTDFWLVYAEAKRAVAKVRAFREWLLAEVARAAGDDADGVLALPVDQSPRT